MQINQLFNYSKSVNLVTIFGIGHNLALLRQKQKTKRPRLMSKVTEMHDVTLRNTY